MLEEKEVKLQARLAAVEFLIIDILSVLYRNIPASKIHQRHDQLIAFLKQRGVPGVDPAVSDLLSGEVENALRELLDDLEAYIGAPR
jgi:hypothetical protein